MFQLVVTEGNVVREVRHIAHHLLRMRELAAGLVIALVLPGRRINNNVNTQTDGLHTGLTQLKLAMYHAAVHQCSSQLKGSEKVVF